jgi:hypothetical protein
MLCGLLAGLGILFLAGGCRNGQTVRGKLDDNVQDERLSSSLASGAFISCTDDSSRYVHDSRTFGIWYNRGRFDSALHFPLLTDTIQCFTQKSPQLYSTGPNALWWFDGQLNHKIGGAGGIVSAANGLQLDGTSVILGYSQTTNLYKAVATITGSRFYGINDADTAGVGSDLLQGPYEMLTPAAAFSAVGPSYNAGWKDPTTGINNYMWADSSGAHLYGILPFDEPYLDLQSNDVTLGLFDYAGLTSSAITLTTYQMEFQADSALIMGVTPSGSGVLTTTLSFKGGQMNAQCYNYGAAQYTNGYFVDNNASFFLQRINASEDSILGGGTPIAVVFNSALSVIGSSIVVSGNDASFSVTFETSTVTTSTDSTILTVTYGAPAVSRYEVMPGCKNAVSAIAYNVVMPYIHEQTSATFSFCGAVVGGIASHFSSNSIYSFSFVTVDHQQ